MVHIDIIIIEKLLGYYIQAQPTEMAISASNISGQNSTSIKLVVFGVQKVSINFHYRFSKPIYYKNVLTNAAIIYHNHHDKSCKLMLVPAYLLFLYSFN